jgi:hypothetical protein
MTAIARKRIEQATRQGKLFDAPNLPRLQERID